jgi:elongation factor P
MALGHTDLRKRTKILIEGKPHIVQDADFVKPGKGQAFTKVKVKNLISGKIFEKTYKSNESAEECVVTTGNMQYLYNDSTVWTFMDMESFEQVEVEKVAMNGVERFLLDNMECQIMIWEGKVLEVEPPTFVDLLITDAPPGVKGDTATNVTRPATLETGAEVHIPLFINEGTRIKVDTRTGEYVERSKNQDK